jgi:hypothetical protein
MTRATSPLGLVAVLAVALFGCEVVTSRDGVQCQTTSDCAARGAAFAGTVCSAGLCEAIDVPTAVTSSGCTTSEDCLFQPGAPGRCVDSACVSLVPQSAVTGSALCTTFGPVASDSAVLFGALLPFGGTIAAGQALGIGTVEAGLPTGTLLNDILSTWNRTAVTATPAAPQFGVVVCDETDLAGAQALLAKVNASFVLGPYTDANLHTILSGTSTTPLFSPLGDGAYLEQSAASNRWFCNANRADAEPAFRNAIDVVATFAATSRSKTSIKLALVEDSAEPNEAAFAGALTAGGLSFNGETDSTSGAYLNLDVNSGTDEIALETTSSGVGISQATQLAVFQPDVVVLTGALWTATLLDQLEHRWSVLNKSLVPPIYLIMHTSPAIAAFAQGGSTASLTNRIFAMESGQSATEANNYGSLQAELGELKLSEPYGASQYNDCLYTALYATAAAQVSTGVAATSLTPAQISQGVAQVTHTVTAAAGRGSLVADSTQIGQLLSLLSDKQTVELVGTASYLGLDANGIPNLNAPTPTSAIDTGHSFSVECPVAAPASPGWKSAGLSYDKSAPGVPVQPGAFGCAN